MLAPVAEAAKFKDIFDAAKNGTVEDVQAFIKSGADVAARDDLLGLTPLILAAYNNPSEAVIEALVKAGAEIDAQDKHGKTALTYAEQNNTAEVIKALEQAGAKN